MAIIKRGRGNGIISGALTMTIATLLVKLLGLGYKIPLSYILSNEGLGYFNSAYTVYSFFYLISVAGVPKAVTIILSEAKESGDEQKINLIFKTAIKAFSLIGLALSALLMIFSGALARFIKNPSSFCTIIIVAPSILFTSVSGVARGYLCAKMRFVNISVSQMLEAIFKCVLGVSLALAASRSGFSEPAVAAMTILGATIGTVVSTFYLFFACKDDKKEKSQEILKQKSKFGFSESEILGRLFRISIPITVSAAVMSLTNMIDLSLIMRRLCEIGYTEQRASALYGIYTTMVVPMIGLVGAVVSPASVSYIPRLTRSYSALRTEDFKEHFEMALRLAAIIAAPMCIGMLFYSEEILCLIFDDADSLISAPLLKISAVGVIFSALTLVINSALEAANFVKAPIYTTVAGAAVKLVVSYFMIGEARFGIFGAPIGTVSAAVITFVFSLLAVRKYLRINTPIFSVLLLPLLASCVMVIFAESVMSGLKISISESANTVIRVILCAFFYSLVLILYLLLSKKTPFFRQNAQKNTSFIMEYDENVSP